MTTRLAAKDRADGLRSIVKQDKVLFGPKGEWVEAREELLEAAKLLDQYDALREFVGTIAGMTTEEEFDEDCPPSEDWICTLNELIERARVLTSKKKGAS